MSSETDHPRQRTVAELLAEHGDAGATGRRRRRREADDADAAVPGPVNGAGTNGVTANGAATNGAGTPTNGTPTNGTGTNRTGTDTGPSGWPPPPPVPDRSVLREPVPAALPPEPARDEPRAFVPEQAPERRRVAPPARFAGPPPVQPAAPPQVQRTPPLPPEPRRERPTEHIPRLPDGRAGAGTSERTGMIDPLLTAPIQHQHPAPVRDAGADDDGPSTMVGKAPVGAEAWHQGRVAGRGRPGRDDLDDDGGPPTQAGAAPLDLDDHPAGLDPADLDPAHPDDGGPAEPAPATSPGQAWAAVVAQWIVGAVGGAALWVGFRFLWRELPVVALAAAVLVTVVLVLIVRGLLRNSDMRTTVSAVLVGLLLTVSPALLVLLGR